MKTYITQTKYNTYKYKRRVPKQLLKLTGTDTFRVSLGSNQLEATQRAVEFNSAIEDAVKLFQLGLPKETIIGKLKHLLPQQKDEKVKHKEAKNGFTDLAAEYLNSQQGNISIEETRDKSYFYKEVCPTIFYDIGLTQNPQLSSVEYKHLLEFKSIVTQLPKRNIQRYRSTPLPQILSQLSSIKDEDKISARTVNKYIKWLRALFNFAVMLKHIEVNLATSLPLQKTINEKLQRLPLTQEELQQLFAAVKPEMKYLLQILAFTGMRLSELYKCKVEEIDGIKCFSLLDKSLKLKTKSSYRIIPIHSSLIGKLEHFESYRDAVTSNNLARVTSNTIKALKLLQSDKKSLYSLRHSFATTLVQRGADTAIVSELLGHSHSTMTLSRYATGFSVKQLREVVQLL